VVGLLVAYDAAGALGVGILGLVRMLPAMVVALLADPGRRWRPERALVFVNAIRLLAAIAAVLAIASGTEFRIAAVFLVSATLAGAGSLVRPTQSALLPALASEPAELVGANVAASAGESAGTFIGPLLAGLLVGVAGDAGAAAIAIAGFAVAVAASTAVHVAEAARPAPRAGSSGIPVVAGIRALRSRPAASAVLAALFAQVVVRGLLTTLVVVASVELLGLGDPGVGGLNAAIGAGGILGVVVVLGMARRARFAPILAFALVGWGLPIAVIGILPFAPVAFLAMAVIGSSNVVVDVVAYTLLQRVLPGHDRPAVFAVIEGIVGLGIITGGLVAPVLIGAAGLKGALIVTGAILPIVAAVTWPRIRGIDAEGTVPEAVSAALRADPLFRRLPLAALERIAADVSPVAFDTGAVLMREGEIGERYLVLTGGSVQVSEDGVARRRCGVGEGIGEIALLRSVPRTATVVALEPTTALAVTRASFLAAMTGHEPSGAVAEGLVATRLARP
jgi:MFS family permease